MAIRAPNRILDLAELERPAYRRVLERMEALIEREPGAYLHPSKRWEYPWALERAGTEPGARVLDLGSGASILPVYLAAEEHCRVTALDRRLPERLGAGSGVEIDYVAGDMTALPFENSAFDAAFCISVIEHLPTGAIEVALREIARVLRADAPLLLTTDYYRDADEPIWYEGPDRRFRVEWGVFDRDRLDRLILDAPDFRVDGEIDLEVEWDQTRPRMRRFHGYPYTSVGIRLVRRPMPREDTAAAGRSGTGARLGRRPGRRPGIRPGNRPGARPGDRPGVRRGAPGR